MWNRKRKVHMSFKRAQRRNAKLRLALSGTAGAGKTYSSLLLAKEFGKKIAVLDSERGSASLYADLCEFDVCELEDKRPKDYIEKIHEAASAGYEVLVIDSYSHSWIGALETVDKMGGWMKAGKVISPEVQKLVDTILSFPGHVIATMRSKADYAIENVNGRPTMRKLGMASVAREGTDFEFGVMLEMTPEGGVNVVKSRCPTISGSYVREDIGKIAKTLNEWLNAGATISPREELAEKIRFAKDEPALMALIPELKALSKEDLAAVKPEYDRRKAEFQGVAE